MNVKRLLSLLKLLKLYQLITLKKSHLRGSNFKVLTLDPILYRHPLSFLLVLFTLSLLLALCSSSDLYLIDSELKRWKFPMGKIS